MKNITNCSTSFQLILTVIPDVRHEKVRLLPVFFWFTSGLENYENYILQNGMEERKIQITDDNELQTAVHRMYYRCPTDHHNKDVYSPGKVLI